MWQSSYDGSPTLYLKPTPIGNLEDMTFRAIEILKTVSVIFCEDTRVTLQLLNHFEIKKKLITLHDHNEEKVKEILLKYLENGESVAIVTDRGTPIISDPGYKTVAYVIEKGYNVVCLPGACAFVPAIVTSGLPTEHFVFYGFLNSNSTKRKKELMELESFPYTVIFYEAPHRIKKTLCDIYEIFGDRDISLSREISKRYESIYHGKLSNLIRSGVEIKGEIVLVVEGNSNTFIDNDMSIIEMVNIYISNGYSVMDAIKKVAKDTGRRKNDIYKEYHGGVL